MQKDDRIALSHIDVGHALPQDLGSLLRIALLIGTLFLLAMRCREWARARVPVILLALTIHEWAHAYTANRLGDPTARHMGRMTLNPLAHLDLFGTLAIVLIGFGWAKPVPVNMANLREPRRHMMWISAAGPLSNLAQAMIFGLLLQIHESRRPTFR